MKVASKNETWSFFFISSCLSDRILNLLVKFPYADKQDHRKKEEGVCHFIVLSTQVTGANPALPKTLMSATDRRTF